MAIGLLVAATGAAGAGVIHVDGSAPVGGDGASWTTAFRYLTDALAAAVPGDEVRLAQGIYRPDRSEALPLGNGDRDASFVVTDVTIRGGFAGLGAADGDLNDPLLWTTTLSGDLAGDNQGGRITLPVDAALAPWVDNARHVVRAAGDSVSLIGLTVTHGSADLPIVIEGLGGGLLSVETDVVLERVRFVQNLARGAGAVYVYDTDSVSVHECEFLDNHAFASMGGALSLQRITLATIEDSIFAGNSSDHSGGAILLIAPITGTVEGCHVLDNNSGFSGGGIQMLLTSNGSIAPDVVLRGCVIAGNVALAAGGIGIPRHCSATGCVVMDNWASTGGGGIYGIGGNSGAHLVRIVSCAVVNNVSGFIAGGIGGGLKMDVDGSYFGKNVAAEGGGLDFYGIAKVRQCTIAGNAPTGVSFSVQSEGQIDNCILWANQPVSLLVAPGASPPLVRSSIVEGGWSGPRSDVLDVDPLMVAPDSQDIRLGVGSPAINWGDPALLPLDVLDVDGDGITNEALPLDLLGGPRVNEGVPDAGAVEGAFEAMPVGAAVEGLPAGETVSLSPESDLPWVVSNVAAEVTNLTGDPAGSASLAEFGWSLHRGASGLTEEGPIGRLTIALAPGAHRSRVRIPFDHSIVPGFEIAELRPTVYDPANHAWRLAVAMNTLAGDGSSEIVGTFHVQYGPIADDPELSDEMGDHGVYFDAVVRRGFVWANVDIDGDFGVGRVTCEADIAPGDGDGVVDGVDLGRLIAAWGSSGPADLDGSGAVDGADLAILIGAWGGCGSGADDAAPAGQSKFRNGPLRQGSTSDLIAEAREAARRGEVVGRWLSESLVRRPADPAFPE